MHRSGIDNVRRIRISCALHSRVDDPVAISHSLLATVITFPESVRRDAPAEDDARGDGGRRGPSAQRGVHRLGGRAAGRGRGRARAAARRRPRKGGGGGGGRRPAGPRPHACVPQELALREREAVLAGWDALQAEVRALHDVWQRTHAAARLQARLVDDAAADVHAADANVAAARRALSAAEKYRLEPAPRQPRGAGGRVGNARFAPAG